MTALKWTRERPGEEGWYWNRWNEHCDPELAWVYLSKGELVLLEPETFDPDTELIRNIHDNREWAGPIPLPEEEG